MMKRILVFMMALLICVSVGMAEGEHKGGRDNGSMNLLNEGIALMNGDGAAQDYDAAMQRFLAADEAGNKKAARYVGLLYEQGLGVEQDYVQAAFWYEKGVSAGDLTSGYYLGLLYKQGLGVEQDYKKAAEYFTSIAASENKSATGVIDAGYELAQLYEQGLGVEQDVDRAIALYQEAAEYGHEAASTALERLVSSWMESMIP